jgi:hypothetical protein
MKALDSSPQLKGRLTQAERKLSEPEVQENFAYFHRVRLERLAFFQAWLLKNFAVKAMLDGDGLKAVSRWIDDVLRRIADIPQTQLAELLPWTWRSENSRQKAARPRPRPEGYR